MREKERERKRERDREREIVSISIILRQIYKSLTQKLFGFTKMGRGENEREREREKERQRDREIERYRQSPQKTIVSDFGRQGVCACKRMGKMEWKKKMSSTAIEGKYFHDHYGLDSCRCFTLFINYASCWKSLFFNVAIEYTLSPCRALISNPIPKSRLL